MLVIVLENAPPRLRGYLTRLFLEVRGLFLALPSYVSAVLPRFPVAGACRDVFPVVRVRRDAHLSLGQQEICHPAAHWLRCLSDGKIPVDRHDYWHGGGDGCQHRLVALADSRNDPRRAVIRASRRRRNRFYARHAKQVGQTSHCRFWADERDFALA